MTHRGPFQPLLFCDSVKVPLSGYVGPGALQRHSDLNMYFRQLGIMSVLPSVLLRYLKEIRFCLSTQAGHKLQVRKKGLPQEIASNLRPAQPQFIYFPPPNSTAHNLFSAFMLCFYLNAGL